MSAVLPIALALAALVLAPAPQAPAQGPLPELATISARLGECSADFTVTDPAGAPVYNAIVHVRIRYGFLGLKRMDLEVGTNSDGRARVEGLPDRARPLVYDITRDTLQATVEQNLATECRMTYDVMLEERPEGEEE